MLSDQMKLFDFSKRIQVFNGINSEPKEVKDKKPSKLGMMMAGAFGGKKNSVVPTE